MEEQAGIQQSAAMSPSRRLLLLWLIAALNVSLGQVSVVISSFKQKRCLGWQIELFLACPIVTHIHVNWFEPNGPAPNNTSKISYDVLPDRISYRFFPRKFKTQAVFTTDVDVFTSCSALKFAHETWMKNKMGVVAFHPRNLRTNGTEIWDEGSSCVGGCVLRIR